MSSKFQVGDLVKGSTNSSGREHFVITTSRSVCLVTDVQGSVIVVEVVEHPDHTHIGERFAESAALFEYVRPKVLANE